MPLKYNTHTTCLLMIIKLYILVVLDGIAFTFVAHFKLQADPEDIVVVW